MPLTQTLISAMSQRVHDRDEYAIAYLGDGTTDATPALANITTVTQHALIDGSRVIIDGAANPSHNGIWVSSANQLIDRTPGFDVSHYTNEYTAQALFRPDQPVVLGARLKVAWLNDRDQFGLVHL